MGAGSSSQSTASSSSDSEQASDSNTQNAAIQTDKYYKPCFFRYITLITRLWGIVLFVGLWGCTVQGFRGKNHSYATYYLLAVAVVVTFFELVWMINKCACCNDTGVCCKVWKAFVWVDDWKKAILYLLFAAPCFTKQLGYVFAYLAAALLIVAAWFYFMKSFRDSSCVMRPIENGEVTSKVVPNQSNGADATDPKARLVATEQKTYDSIPPAANLPRSSVSSEPVDQYATSPSENGKSSAFITADEQEPTPAGYTFDYGNRNDTAKIPEPTAPEPEDKITRPPRTNPFDYENVDVIQSPYVENERSTLRAPSTNPFDEDSFEHEIETNVQPPSSTNPFD